MTGKQNGIFKRRGQQGSPPYISLNTCFLNKSKLAGEFTLKKNYIFHSGTLLLGMSGSVPGSFVITTE